MLKCAGLRNMSFTIQYTVVMKFLIKAKIYYIFSEESILYKLTDKQLQDSQPKEMCFNNIYLIQYLKHVVRSA